jgi:hypothetical protein
MTLTVRELDRLSLVIDRIHDRWFDLDAIIHDPSTREVRIPFRSETTSKPPINRRTGEPEPSDQLLVIHEADEPAVEDQEHIGTYSFNDIRFSNQQVVIRAEPNLRIKCTVKQLHIKVSPVSDGS